jgi:hypothetical protein
MAQEENKEKSILETISSLGSESEILETAEETEKQPENTLEAAVFKVWGEDEDTQDAEDSVTDKETESDEEVTEEEEDDGIEGTKTPDEGPSDGTEVKEEEDEEDEEDEEEPEEGYMDSDSHEDEEGGDEEEVDTDDVEVTADDAEADTEDEVEDEVVGDDDSDEEESDVEDEVDEAEHGDSEEDDAIDGAAEPDQDVDDAVNSISKTVIKAATAKAQEKINATYGGMKEDIDALCADDETLSEDFKTKAATIFEAAVTSKVATHIEEIQESYVDFVNEEVNTLHEGLVDKIDSYLTYVAEQWIEKNDVAVTNVLRTEIAEAFMASLKENFVDHYIEMPEGKTDMFDEVTQQNAALAETVESKDEEIGKLAEEVISLKREKIISELAEGLADTQINKFKKLTADIAFESVETFTDKVKVIRESYFNKSEKVEEEVVEQSNSTATKEVVVTEEVTSEEPKLSPIMSQYVKAFGKLDKEAF